MVYTKVSTTIELELVSPHTVEEVYAIVENNREYLAEYLNWLDKTKSSEDVYQNTRNALSRFADKKGIDYVIKKNGRIIGRISIWQTNEDAKVYEIGYWIVKEQSRKGIMTLCAKEMLKVGIEYLKAEKFEIYCIAENTGSNKVARKLGFTHEGTIRNSIKVNERLFSMNVFGLLKDEYLKNNVALSNQ